MTRLWYRPMPLLALVLCACGTPPALPESGSFGGSPALPQPRLQKMPVVKTAPIVGWSDDQAPVPAKGLKVTEFARDLDHPRWLYELPNGDVLVSESDAPPNPDSKKGGLRGWIQGLVMKRAGSVNPSANRITLLRDGDGDGVAEMRSALLENLNSPFGMALVGPRL